MSGEWPGRQARSTVKGLTTMGRATTLRGLIPAQGRFSGTDNVPQAICNLSSDGGSLDTLL